MTRTLVEAWVIGGAAVASGCIETPGPLKEACRGGQPRALEALILEFTFSMMSRWFRYIKGGEGDSPVQRVQAKTAWIRCLATLFEYTNVPKRVTISIRLDSLFNSECEANIEAEASPSALGLVTPGSLSPAEAAGLIENHLSSLDTTQYSSTKVGMAVMSGRVSVSEPYILGMRALGLFGRLQRFYPLWHEVRSTPVRPSASLMGAIPPRLWGRSGALALVRLLDTGMGALCLRLAEFPAVQSQFGPPDW